MVKTNVNNVPFARCDTRLNTGIKHSLRFTLPDSSVAHSVVAAVSCCCARWGQLGVGRQG